MMKQLTPLVFALSLTGSVYAEEAAERRSSVAAVSPALAAYDEALLGGKLWQRPALAPRDRSIVTVAALIARSHTASLGDEIERALTNGVTPTEISEIATHLAFYAGWGTTDASAAIIEKVFSSRGITVDQLPPAQAELMPQDKAAEAARVQAVAGLLGEASPGLADFTRDPLFSEIWLRPGLAPRERSLVTVTSLIALGQTGQLAGHLNRALANGLTPEEAGETVAHLAFYSGWPTAFSAGPILRDVLEKRANP